MWRSKDGDGFGSCGSLSCGVARRFQRTLSKWARRSSIWAGCLNVFAEHSRKSGTKVKATLLLLLLVWGYSGPLFGQSAELESGTEEAIRIPTETWMLLQEELHALKLDLNELQTINSEQQSLLADQQNLLKNSETIQNEQALLLIEQTTELESLNSSSQRLIEQTELLQRQKSLWKGLAIAGGSVAGVAIAVTIVLVVVGF